MKSPVVLAAFVLVLASSAARADHVPVIYCSDAEGAIQAALTVEEDQVRYAGFMNFGATRLGGHVYPSLAHYRGSGSDTIFDFRPSEAGAPMLRLNAPGASPARMLDLFQKKRGGSFKATVSFVTSSEEPADGSDAVETTCRAAN